MSLSFSRLLSHLMWDLVIIHLFLFWGVCRVDTDVTSLIVRRIISKPLFFIFVFLRKALICFRLVFQRKKKAFYHNSKMRLPTAVEKQMTCLFRIMALPTENESFSHETWKFLVFFEIWNWKKKRLSYDASSRGLLTASTLWITYVIHPESTPFCNPSYISCLETIILYGWSSCRILIKKI